MTEKSDNSDDSVDGTTISLASISGAAKVIGKLSQSGTYGVLGENTASSGTDSHGVVGITDSEDDGVAGVKGEARAAGGGGIDGHESYGVHGISRADANSDASAFPAGVKGEANGSGIPRGVVGITSAKNGTGGLFENKSSSGSRADGVRGVTRSSGTGATGVTGKANADGEVYGVLGTTSSTNQNSAGVKGSRTSQSAEGYGVLSSGPFKTTEGAIHEQRGDPGTGDLSDGEVMTYNSDGSGTGSAGDLIYAINDGGTIKTQIIAQRSNAT